MQKESKSDKKSTDLPFWGKLVATNGLFENFTLTREKYTIGKDSFNDICIDHKNIIDFHCILKRNSETEVVIENYSDTEILIDKEEVPKGKISEILSGNELIFPPKSKTSDGESSIGFILLIKPPDGVYLKPNKLKVAIQSALKARVPKVDSELEEMMTCKICMDIIYKCVNTLPCQHNFCASCYTDCMKHSSSCPDCMEEVEYVERNHWIDNFLINYLAKHPDKKRKPEEYKEMDERNQIKTDKMKVEYKSSYNFDKPQNPED